MKIFQSIGKLFLGIIGFIIVAGILIAFLVGKDDATKVTTKDGKQVESTSGSVAKLGDSVQVGDWEYTFTNAKTAKTVKGIMGGSQTPDHDQFLVVDVEVKNVGKDKCTLSETNFTLKDKDGLEYSASSKNHNDLMLRAVNPKGKVKGTLAFEVPNGSVKDFKMEASGGFSSSKTMTIELG